ncbi:hypothetical protein OF83DRAFT_1165416 [Amylostereum chailletii]|nr:hypothetical protein OF83DRAFT_1165416 [Amylostereum chailletii]
MPFTRLGFFRIGGRSTAIKMADGGVWVLASTPLDEETKKTIDNLGPVKWIIGADDVHHLFLGEFQKAYPDAKLVAVEGSVKKHPELKWHGYWTDEKREQEFGFDTEFKSCYFPGFRNKDVVFVHVPSKTLITADLLFNLPCIEQYTYSWFPSGVPFLNWFLPTMSPESPAHQKFLLQAAKKGGYERANVLWELRAMKRDAKTVADWDFDRIIMCHGEVIETGGNKAWRSAYRLILEDGKSK